MASKSPSPHEKTPSPREQVTPSNIEHNLQSTEEHPFEAEPVGAPIEIDVRCRLAAPDKTLLFGGDSLLIVCLEQSAGDSDSGYGDSSSV